MWLKAGCRFAVIGRGGALCALLLAATACSALKREWPNLATVPSRESAFVKTPKAKSVIPQPPRMGAGEVTDAHAVVKAIEEDIVDLRQQFAAAKSGVQTADRDYRAAISALFGTKGDVEALTTAQLHLSRLARNRDMMRHIADKLERHAQDLNDLTAKAALRDDGALADFQAEVATAVKVWNAFAAGELDRMTVLSAEGPAGKSVANSAVMPIRESDVANLGTAKVGTQFIIRASGTAAALAAKNPLVIAAMSRLVGQGVPFENIALASEVGAQDPVQITVYMQSR